MSAPKFQAEAALELCPLRSPTLPPATHTNCWLLGTDRLTVVDPGSPWTEELEKLLDAVGSRTIERIFLTHHHYDHASGAEELRKRTGAPIASHPETARRLDFPVQESWSDGEMLKTGERSWTIIHTPGHATGHLCLRDGEDGTVIAGDMVAGEGTILLEPEEGDLEHYLDSLRRLMTLRPERLLPAHGPVLDDAIATLTEYIQHRLMRTEQIIRALAMQNTPTNIMDIVPTIYTQLDPGFFGIAARQLQCHMNWLVDNDIVRESGPEVYALIDPAKLRVVIDDRGWIG